MAKVSVVIPSFNHGPTLEYAIESVRRQSFEDFELLIVGDGISDAGRDVATRAEAADPRVRFFDNPKGPNHGELHRDAAIRAASGEVIAYLGDDDVWFPDHLATMLDLLGDGDFAYGLPAVRLADGTLVMHYGDIKVMFYREWMHAGNNNFVAPAATVHTRESYLRLPHGWTTAKPGEYADLTLWRQFIDLPDLEVRKGAVVTVLMMPDKDPTRAAGEQARIDQMRAALDEVSDPERASALRQAVLDEFYDHASRQQADALYLRQFKPEGA